MTTANELQAQQACLTAILCLIRATQIVAKAKISQCEMEDIDALARVLMSAQLALKKGLASLPTQPQATFRAVAPCALLVGRGSHGLEGHTD